MSKKWYPVVDYTICKECGACIKKCNHGVFDNKKSPSPVVVYTNGCVEHCHGCGNLCPVGAITYVGDYSGWIPPNGEKIKEESCCCSEKSNDKKVVVEYLYLDLKVCDRCIGTDSVLEDVLAIIIPVLQLAGYEVAFNKVKIDTIEMANKYRFVSSPTILVNGQDICKTVEENNCDCCGKISNSKVDCRIFRHNDKVYEIPPKEMLAENILKIVLGSQKTTCSCDQYILPKNLENFFAGKNEKNNCSCGGNCC